MKRVNFCVQKMKVSDAACEKLAAGKEATAKKKQIMKERNKLQPCSSENRTGVLCKREAHKHLISNGMKKATEMHVVGMRLCPCVVFPPCVLLTLSLYCPGSKRPISITC